MRRGVIRICNSELLFIWLLPLCPVHRPTDRAGVDAAIRVISFSVSAPETYAATMVVRLSPNVSRMLAAIVIQYPLSILFGPKVS